MTETLIPLRPNRRNLAICTEAAKQLLPSVLEWLEQGGEKIEDDDEEKENVLNQIAKALRDSHDLDGYELAKRLEDKHYWSADRELVDVMESAFREIYKAENDAIKIWVAEYKIVPGHKIGDFIEYTHSPFILDEIKKGKIVDVRMNDGIYIVQEEGRSYSVEFIKDPITKEKVEYKLGTHVPYEQVKNDQAWWTEERRVSWFKTGV